jgi:hypothetical protein
MLFLCVAFLFPPPFFLRVIYTSGKILFPVHHFFHSSFVFYRYRKLSPVDGFLFLAAEGGQWTADEIFPSFVIGIIFIFS